MIRVIHPLIIPIYAFAFYIELERQSYSIDLIPVLIIIAMTAILSWITMRISREACHNNGNDLDPLTNINAGIKPRLIVATGLTIAYISAHLMCIRMQTAYNWGISLVFPIFIIPTWINVLSGRGLQNLMPGMEGKFPANICLAPASYLGTLSAFTIILGHKNSADTFILFTITMLLTAIEAHHHMARHNGRLSHILYGYLIGIIPSIIIMFIFA